MIVVNNKGIVSKANSVPPHTSYPLDWPLVWFVAALPEPAAAPALKYGPGQTAHRPLSAGHTPATAGSSPEPGRERGTAYNDKLHPIHDM